MAGRLKSLAASQAKYATNAANARKFYTDGMAGIIPAEWEAATVAGAKAYESGVQQAIQDKRFQSGVVGKGAKLVARAQDVGGGRYAEGVGKAGPEWSKGFNPYYDTIAATLPTLPPRGPRGDQGNKQRSGMMNDALHNRRRQRAG